MQIYLIRNSLAPAEFCCFKKNLPALKAIINLKDKLTPILTSNVVSFPTQAAFRMNGKVSVHEQHTLKRRCLHHSSCNSHLMEKPPVRTVGIH